MLLAHQPRSARGRRAAGFDLQLSGHTHGGQFFPWNFFVRLQQPFTAGLHRLARAVGLHQPRHRLLGAAEAFGRAVGDHSAQARARVTSRAAASSPPGALVSDAGASDPIDQQANSLMTMQRESDPPRADPPKHFSMLRTFHLADFFTLANAACGMASIFYAMTYVGSRSVGDFLIAAAMTPAAFVFDVLDGRIARWRHQHRRSGASWIRSRTSSRSALRLRRLDLRPACAAAGIWRR